MNRGLNPYSLASKGISFFTVIPEGSFLIAFPRINASEEALFFDEYGY